MIQKTVKTITSTTDTTQMMIRYVVIPGCATSNSTASIFVPAGAFGFTAMPTV